MSLDASIDRYVDVVFTGYQATLHEITATLAEPCSGDPAELRRVGERLVETLSAFVIGHAIRCVLQGLPPSPALLAEVTRSVLAIPPPRFEPSALPPRRDLPGAGVARPHRPVVESIAALLQIRICLGARHARDVLRTIATTITSHEPAAGPRFARTLERLADPVTAFAFGDQLALGWQHFLAVIEDRDAPAVPHEPRWQRGRALWAAWLRRVRGVPRAQVQASRDYILRVA